MPWFKKRSDTPAKVPTDTSPNGVYSALRHRALSTNRGEAEIAIPPAEAPAWGILMETGYDEATVTLLALSSGTTSLYISNGSGVSAATNLGSRRGRCLTKLKERTSSLQLRLYLEAKIK